jgi:hypothetical protein
MKQSPWVLEKLIVTWLVKVFPAFYGTHSYITMLKDAATASSPELHESNSDSPILYIQDSF